MKMFHSRSTFICIWSLSLIIMVFFVNNLIFPVNSEPVTGRSEMILTVVPAVNQSHTIQPKEYTFVTHYLKSTFVENLEDSKLNLTFPQNTLGWSGFNYSIYNITMFDNIGNFFDPIIETNKIQNPRIEVILPPHFEYSISLSFFTDYGVFFDAERMEYVYPFDMNNVNPTTVSLRFPKNYTILQYSPEGQLNQENNFIAVTWLENTEFNVFTRFLPFSLHGSMTSFKATIDFSTVFPTKGQVKGTIEKTLLIPIRLDIWKINPGLIVNMPFPEYAQNIVVENVWDAIGNCNEIFQPIKNLNINSSGQYFVDFSNRTVVVYPRYSYGDEFYQYHVSVTFVTPSEYAPYKWETAKQKDFPYQYESSFEITDIGESENWKQDLTGNLEITFILPKGTNPLKSESGNPEIGIENDRPTATFTYNSPKTISPSRWHVIYDVISVRNYFWLAVFSIVFSILTIILLLFVNIPSTHKLIFELVPGTGLMITSILNFLGLGGTENALNWLLCGSLAFWIISLIVGIWKTHSHEKAKSPKTRNSQRPRSKYHI